MGFVVMSTEIVVMSTDTFGKFRQKKSSDGPRDRQCGKTDASKDGQATGHGGGVSHTRRHVNSTNGGGFESNHVSDAGAGTVRQSNWQPYNYHHKDCQVTPERMSLGARLAVNTPSEKYTRYTVVF